MVTCFAWTARPCTAIRGPDRAIRCNHAEDQFHIRAVSRRHGRAGRGRPRAGAGGRPARRACGDPGAPGGRVSAALPAGRGPGRVRAGPDHGGRRRLHRRDRGHRAPVRRAGRHRAAAGGGGGAQRGRPGGDRRRRRDSRLRRCRRGDGGARGGGDRAGAGPRRGRRGRLRGLQFAPRRAGRGEPVPQPFAPPCASGECRRGGHLLDRARGGPARGLRGGGRLRPGAADDGGREIRHGSVARGLPDRARSAAAGAAPQGLDAGGHDPLRPVRPGDPVVDAAAGGGGGAAGGAEHLRGGAPVGAVRRGARPRRRGHAVRARRRRAGRGGGADPGDGESADSSPGSGARTAPRSRSSPCRCWRCITAAAGPAMPGRGWSRLAREGGARA